MKTTGKLDTVALNFQTNKARVTLELNTNDIEVIDELNGELLDIEIKKIHKGRSLNSNNYAWHLMTEIGNVMRMDKEEVYLKMLKCYGQSNMISVLSSVPVERFLKYYEKAGESILNGKKFMHYKVYTGTSEYNTKEMSIFLDGVVQEAKSLGIETLTPDELSRLKEEWN